MGCVVMSTSVAERSVAVHSETSGVWGSLGPCAWSRGGVLGGGTLGGGVVESAGIESNHRGLVSFSRGTGETYVSGGMGNGTRACVGVSSRSTTTGSSVSAVGGGTAVGGPVSCVAVGMGSGVAVRDGVSSGAGMGYSAGAAAAMSSALLAHHLPPLPKFDGGVSLGTERESVKEWLEQFGLVAGVCKWDGPTKLVNLVTRLKGEAYAFYKSCTPQQRSSYEEMAEALTQRFTPVRIQAVQSSLFHGRRQGERESVDSYAQALRMLFHKDYPNAQRGSLEAESMGKAVLASQFSAGLIPEIKAKVAGNKGDFDVLLVKARFEEAKLRDLVGGQNRPKKPPPSFPISRQAGETSGHQVGSGQSQCGIMVVDPWGTIATSVRLKGRVDLLKLLVDRRGKGPGPVANIASEEPDAGEPKRDGDSVKEALDKAMATMHTLSSKASGNSVELSPVPMVEVEWKESL